MKDISIHSDKINRTKQLCNYVETKENSKFRYGKYFKILFEMFTLCFQNKIFFWSFQSSSYFQFPLIKLEKLHAWNIKICSLSSSRSTENGFSAPIYRCYLPYNYYFKNQYRNALASQHIFLVNICSFFFFASGLCWFPAPRLVSPNGNTGFIS